MSEIEITIAPDGSVKVEAKGFKGKSCTDATRQLEESLGVSKGRTLKTEFNQPIAATHQLGGGK